MNVEFNYTIFYSVDGECIEERERENGYTWTSRFVSSSRPPKRRFIRRDSLNVNLVSN